MSTNGARSLNVGIVGLPTTALTVHQRRCKEFIRQFTALHAYAPSYQEIMQALGLSSRSEVHRIVRALVRHGHLTRVPGWHRSVQIIDPEGRQVAIDFIRDRILAGSGLLQIMESIDKPVEFITEGEVIEAVRLAWRELQPAKSEAA